MITTHMSPVIEIPDMKMDHAEYNAAIPCIRLVEFGDLLLNHVTQVWTINRYAHECNYTRNMLIPFVAVPGTAGDYAVYAGEPAQDFYNKERAYKWLDFGPVIVQHGLKVPRHIAVALFPQFEANLKWRY